MTATTHHIANALGFLESQHQEPMKVKDWEKLRNAFLKESGVCGVLKGEKKSKSFPPWWSEQTEFWFADPVREADFVSKWS